MQDPTKLFEETPVAPPQWDVGVFTVWDANSDVVALLWVTNNGNKLKATEYWGLGPSWVWPSSADTKVTYRFEYDASYGTPTEASFKQSCDKLFGTTTYQKHTVAEF